MNILAGTSDLHPLKRCIPTLFSEMMHTYITEYSNQLPAEGGAFYHVDTLDSARAHYRKSWPSILHALAIWLKEAGFAKLNKGANHVAGEPTLSDTPANLYSEEANAERLYLIIGWLQINVRMCVKCCPRLAYAVRLGYQGITFSAYTFFC